MATESTAIVNLVDLMKQKPVPVSTGDDELFGGMARFDPMAMPVVAEPISLPSIDQQRIRISPPLGVKSEDPRRALLKKLAIPTGLFAVAMIGLSIFLAVRDGKKPAANVAVVHAPAPAVQPIEAPAPVVQPIEEAQPVVAPVPVEEQKLEPTVPEPTVPEVNDAPAPEEQVAEKPVVHKKTKAKRAAKRAKAATRVAVAEQPKAKVDTRLGGKGALQLSSSPSREVWVDGRNTKHMTPQRLTLQPGTHNITLFDKTTRSAKTFQVEIKPNETTRVAKKY